MEPLELLGIGGNGTVDELVLYGTHDTLAGHGYGLCPDVVGVLVGVLDEVIKVPLANAPLEGGLCLGDGGLRLGGDVLTNVVETGSGEGPFTVVQEGLGVQLGYWESRDQLAFLVYLL